jgi:hypothetical protein
LAALGNCIRSFEDLDEFENDEIEDENDENGIGQNGGDIAGLLFLEPDDIVAAAMRERIAKQMWRDYQDYLAMHP